MIVKNDIVDCVTDEKIRNFSQALYDVMFENNVSVLDLSYAIRTSTQSIYNWLNESNLPTLEKMVSISVALDVDINELLYSSKANKHKKVVEDYID